MKASSTPRISPVDVLLQEPLKSEMAKIFPADVPSPNLYRSIARNESLFIDMIKMRLIGRTGLLDRKTIPSRLRELLILRTCVQARNDYEFNLHVKTISEKMGLKKSEIEDLCNARINDGLWLEHEVALISLVDGLVQAISVPDDIYQRVAEHYSDAELIEIVQLVGLYTSVAMLVSLIRPELDPY